MAVRFVHRPFFHYSLFFSPFLPSSPSPRSPRGRKSASRYYRTHPGMTSGDSMTKTAELVSYASYFQSLRAPPRIYATVLRQSSWFPARMPKGRVTRVILRCLSPLAAFATLDPMARVDVQTCQKRKGVAVRCGPCI